ncbi:MAG: hypothetical protein HUJ31_19180 [Pseudomonadales bacterium]|nr:hypothetical protein [Pseudomonadales bacterium]
MRAFAGASSLIGVLLAVFPVTAQGQRPLWDTGASDHFSLSGLDLYSAQCLGCHDLDTSYSVSRVGLSTGSGFGETGHPVGFDYRDAISRPGNRSNYSYPDELDPALALPDGKVSCITCHDHRLPEFASDPHGALVMSNRNGRMCISCHRM